jgi:hypothetical protein
MSIFNSDAMAESPDSLLSWQFMRTYLKRSGHSPENVYALPADVAKELMTAASLYASLKMAEIEALSKFRQKIRIKYIK